MVSWSLFVCMVNENNNNRKKNMVFLKFWLLPMLTWKVREKDRKSGIAGRFIKKIKKHHELHFNVVNEEHIHMRIVTNLTKSIYFLVFWECHLLWESLHLLHSGLHYSYLISIQWKNSLSMFFTWLIHVCFELIIIYELLSKYKNLSQANI